MKIVCQLYVNKNKKKLCIIRLNVSVLISVNNIFVDISFKQSNKQNNILDN